MSDKYKIYKGDDPYFVTFTIVEWLKVLSKTYINNRLISDFS